VEEIQPVLRTCDIERARECSLLGGNVTNLRERKRKGKRFVSGKKVTGTFV